MDNLDLKFYTIFYDDLKVLKTRENLINHYFTKGKEEKRLPNVFKLIDRLKEIHFDVNFYKKLKNLDVENSCYQSAYVYKNYLKNLDFKNRQELSNFLKKNRF